MYMQPGGNYPNNGYDQPPRPGFGNPQGGMPGGGMPPMGGPGMCPPPPGPGQMYPNGPSPGHHYAPPSPLPGQVHPGPPHHHHPPPHHPPHHHHPPPHHYPPGQGFPQPGYNPGEGPIPNWNNLTPILYKVKIKSTVHFLGGGDDEIHFFQRSKKVMVVQSLASEGDWGVLFTSHEEKTRVKLTKGVITQSRAGRFWHDDLIGAAWGQKILDRKNDRKWAVLLPLTPELRSVTIDHHTQIVYGPDLALITSLLDIQAGQRILETGTGSGSATVSLARSVGSIGKVFTYEFHEARFNKAVENFAQLGLSDVITCIHRDAYKDGFLVDDIVTPNSIDGAMLDLPSPWLALDHIDIVLKPGAKVAVFSPCYEQVQEAAAKLRAMRYTDVDAFETICKPWGAWTEADVIRRAKRCEEARKKNHMEERTTKEPLAVAMEKTAIFQINPTTMYQLSTRGHTGYIMIATKQCFR